MLSNLGLFINQFSVKLHFIDVVVPFVGISYAKSLCFYLHDEATRPLTFVMKFPVPLHSNSPIILQIDLFNIHLT